MEANLDKMQIQYKVVEQLSDLKKLPALRPFDENVCLFLSDLSDKLLKDKRSKQFPDVITFAFFLRRANLFKLKNEYDTQNCLGRGLSFHIAPSNVPINFAYSLAAGLLAGNSCVVRASSKDFFQTKLICDNMKQVTEATNNPAAAYAAVVTYDRTSDVTDVLSQMCDIRVIWGGDETVAQIRRSPLPARAIDIAFADRYSVCVINAEAVLKLDSLTKAAQDFYNDTYLYDQNACSSPRLIYWLGDSDTVKEAKKRFWLAVHDNIISKYKVEPVIAVDKLTMSYRAAIELDDVVLETSADNLIYRIQVSKLDKALMRYSCPGGSFLEYADKDMQELLKMDDKKLQTLSYLGCNGKDIHEWVLKNGLSGIDRIVPMGKTADFSLTWDGYDLIHEMSRKVYCDM